MNLIILSLMGNLREKYPIILRMREQSVAGLLSPPKEACEGG